MDIAAIMNNMNNEQDLKDANVKISIFNGRVTGDDSIGSMKRIRTQIHWKEGPVEIEKERKLVQRRSWPALGLLICHGYRWHYIYDAMLKLRLEELKRAKHPEKEIPATRARGLMQDLGRSVFQKRYNKNVDLTVNQQTNLEQLKMKVKERNDAYLRRHPEINVMIRLVYAALFKNRPKKPKDFVSKYVHHLNTHREELVIEDFDVPFDRPAIPEEILLEEEERRQIGDFARQIVERCLDLAAHGASYVDVMTIINSILKSVSPSEDDISIKSSIASAEAAVSEVLRSLMTSVIMERSTSAELVVDDVLSLILSNALPFVQKDSEVYLEMKSSVENFIRSLIQQMTYKATNSNHITIEDIMNEPETLDEKKQLQDGPSKSILKRDSILKNTQKNKVKFQSFQS